MILEGPSRIEYLEFPRRRVSAKVAGAVTEGSPWRIALARLTPPPGGSASTPATVSSSRSVGRMSTVRTGYWSSHTASFAEGGTVKDERHVRLFLEQGVAMLHRPVIAELFPMVRRDHEQGAVRETELLDLFDQASDLVVGVADLAVVPRHDVLQVAGGWWFTCCGEALDAVGVGPGPRTSYSGSYISLYGSGAS